ncbi:MCR_0457 family protein [Acinetobacter towneri]|uniref:MCR_0457 family protein n=1 Tax=Acinetobacter towneri TaxID=202956 RepID=UPI001F37F567|nr:hypothetical protein [Acinetobacter towneri]UIP24335.1 hypothetical protein LZG54_09225 [Acinetobacter towneri]
MILALPFRRLLGLGFAVVMTQAVVASDLTAEEANTIIKEDVAAAQVMTEMCPALIGKNAKLDSNIQALIQTYLQDYSESNMTLAKLQADTEYQSVLTEARQAATDTSADEQKAVCLEALELAL